ncbi:MAG TPA: alpha/beta hydrolase [Streptosporangiaceae bacterium]|nr:alpha/beta hydrolase [Streptosporangiaceae bacterium]
MVGELVSVNGVELYLRHFGEPGLPVLVVVHGGPGWDHTYLLPQVSQLAERRHVVLFDLRGCGRSSRVRPARSTTAQLINAEMLQPDLIADDIAALLDLLGGGSGDVLGFSYGGMVAMRVVDQYPGLVDRLILASTTAYRDFAEELRASADYAARTPLVAGIDFGHPLAADPDAQDGALARAMAFDSVPYDIWRLDRRDEWEAVLRQVLFSDDWNEPYTTGALRPGAPAEPARVLREWGRPVLILHGVHDMGFPVGVARRLHAAVPGSTLAEVPDAAHMAHFDNPDQWLSAIGDFLPE